MHSNDDENQNREAQYQDQQIAIGKAAGEVGLEVLGARSQSGQLLIAQGRYGRLQLRRIEVSIGQGLRHSR